MSTDRELTRVVRSWLDEDLASFPDRVLDGALDQVHATRQRRPLWPAWRLPEMNLPVRIAIAAAVVVIAVVAAINLLPDQNGVGGQSPTPSASASPEPSVAATPVPAMHEGDLAPGTYRTQPYPNSTLRLVFTVPSGWAGHGTSGLYRTDVGTGAPDGLAIAFLGVGNLYSDPCNGTSGDVETGASVAGLVDALALQTAYEVGEPVDVSLSGFDGQRVDLVLPSDVDFSTCTNDGGDPTARAAGLGGYFVWQSDAVSGSNVYAQGPGNRFHVWILDVAGTRRVVLTHDYAGTSAAHLAEVQGILDSVAITP